MRTPQVRLETLVGLVLEPASRALRRKALNAPAEMVVGLNQDVGDLVRLSWLPAAAGATATAERAELGHEFAECLLWIFSLAHSFEVERSEALIGFVEERKRRLQPAVRQLAGKD